jgi:phospholipid/cholesterol/gamma-HCH transport system ATP-binding protein
MALASEKIALELRDVSVSFGPDLVLRNINLQIPEGEAFVIIGPSGQGKTTLLKTLSGLVRPTRGQTLIGGQDFHALPNTGQQKLTRKLGMLFQKNALFDSLTVGENIAFPLREVTVKTEVEIQSIVDKFLDAVGIAHAKALFPDEISGGMQKRLGIARALALAPQTIFYDDPTAGLDPITSRKIIDLIVQLRRQLSATVVAITNDMNRAYQMADRIGMVVDKELIVTGSPGATRDHSDVRVRQFIQGSLTGPLTERAML